MGLAASLCEVVNTMGLATGGILSFATNRRAMPESFSVSVPGHAELRINTSSGKVVVVAEERENVLVEAGVRSPDDIERDATGRMRIASARGGSADLELRCPAGTDLVVGTLSGHIELRGHFGAVRVNTVSGDIGAEAADEFDVRSISGHIRVDTCAGDCLLRTKSGRTEVGKARDVHISSISGKIRIDETTGTVRAQTVSGNVEVGTERDGDVAVQTMSGSVRVAVPEGVRPQTRLRSLSGRPRSDCEEGSDCQIAVRSLSGKIEVVRGS